MRKVLIAGLSVAGSVGYAADENGKIVLLKKFGSTSAIEVASVHDPVAPVLQAFAVENGLEISVVEASTQGNVHEMVEQRTLELAIELSNLLGPSVEVRAVPSGEMQLAAQAGGRPGRGKE